jgi:hypothetical protein
MILFLCTESLLTRFRTNKHGMSRRREENIAILTESKEKLTLYKHILLQLTTNTMYQSQSSRTLASTAPLTLLLAEYIRFLRQHLLHAHSPFSNAKHETTISQNTDMKEYDRIFCFLLC